MESRSDNNASNMSMPRSRASRNEQLYKDINKIELRNYEVKSNATVLGDNRRSIDVDKIKSILDTHYNDAPKRRTIDIRQEEKEANNPIFETKEYDINVVIDKAKDQKKSNFEEDQHSKLSDTQFSILNDLDLDDEPRDERAINENKSKELEELINTISINEKEVEEAKKKEAEKEPEINEDTTSIESDETEEEDLFASLLGDDESTIIEKPSNELMKEIDELETEKIAVEEEIVEDKKEKPKKEKKKEEKDEDEFDNSFFTKSNAIKKKDFEDFQEISDEEESSNTFVKVFIIILLIVFIIGIIILIKSFI